MPVCQCAVLFAAIASEAVANEARADVVATVFVIYIEDVVVGWLVLESLAHSAHCSIGIWGEVTTCGFSSFFGRYLDPSYFIALQLYAAVRVRRWLISFTTLRDASDVT